MAESKRGTSSNGVKLFTTASFNRAVKKLHGPQKAELDRAVQQIALDVECGQEKVGDLAGVRVYKFKISNQQCLLAYRVLERHAVKLLAFGPHENFYRDLKRDQ